MAAKRIAQSAIVKRLMSADARYVSPVSQLSQYNHTVSNFERRMLVWSGKFRNAEEVPAHVSRDTMERARDHFRIRINLGLAAATIIGCFVMVISGKNAAHRGETIQEYNERWHRNYNETHPIHH